MSAPVLSKLILVGFAALACGCAHRGPEAQGPELTVFVHDDGRECTVRDRVMPCDAVVSAVVSDLKLPLDSFIAVSVGPRVTQEALGQSSHVLAVLKDAGYRLAIGSIEVPR